MTDSMKMTAEQQMALLEAAIREAPSFDRAMPLSEADLRWLGRAEALLDGVAASTELIDFRVARRSLRTLRHDRAALIGPLHTAYFKAELRAAPGARGAFIPAGDTWNGYAALVQLFQRECHDLMVIDPYLNAGAFIEFMPHTVAVAGVRFLTAKRNENHGGLVATAQKWASDPVSAGKPATVRYATGSALHDRLIIFDANEAYLISQSIKDIAKRSPASVSRADPELSRMKAEHYNSVWEQATPIEAA